MKHSYQVVLNNPGPVQRAPSSFRLHSHNSPERQQLEQFVVDQFERIHGAKVSHFLPLMMVMNSAEDSSTQGLVCFHPGFCGPMFLENYLSLPVEQVVAGALEVPIDRDLIIEIGNLAVGHRGRGFQLFAVMTAVLFEAGYHWMTFTATEDVERLIGRLGYHPVHLATATAEHLGDAGKEWGQYYARRPRVMVGDIGKARETIYNNPRVRPTLDLYHAEIQHLASCLRDHRRVARAKV